MDATAMTDAKPFINTLWRKMDALRQSRRGNFDRLLTLRDGKNDEN